MGDNNHQNRRYGDFNHQKPFVQGLIQIGDVNYQVHSVSHENNHENADAIKVFIGVKLILLLYIQT